MDSPATRLKVDFDAIEDPFKPKKTPIMDHDDPNFDPFKPRKTILNTDSELDHLVNEVFVTGASKFDQSTDATLLAVATKTAVTPSVEIQTPAAVEENASPQITAPPADAPNMKSNSVKIKKERPKPKAIPKPDLDFELIEDPFKGKKSLALADDPVAPKVKIDFNAIEYPFKFKKGLAIDSDPIIETAEDLKEDIKFDEIKDPFKPKKALPIDLVSNPNAKSPPISNIEVDSESTEDPFKAKKALALDSDVQFNNSKQKDFESTDGPLNTLKLLASDSLSSISDDLSIVETEQSKEFIKTKEEVKEEIKKGVKPKAVKKKGPPSRIREMMLAKKANIKKENDDVILVSKDDTNKTSDIVADALAPSSIAATPVVPKVEIYFAAIEDPFQSKNVLPMDLDSAPNTKSPSISNIEIELKSIVGLFKPIKALALDSDVQLNNSKQKDFESTDDPLNTLKLLAIDSDDLSIETEQFKEGIEKEVKKEIRREVKPKVLRKKGPPSPIREMMLAKKGNMKQSDGIILIAKDDTNKISDIATVALESSSIDATPVASKVEIDFNAIKDSFLSKKALEKDSDPAIETAMESNKHASSVVQDLNPAKSWNSDDISDKDFKPALEYFSNPTILVELDKQCREPSSIRKKQQDMLLNIDSLVRDVQRLAAKSCLPEGVNLLSDNVTNKDVVQLNLSYEKQLQELRLIHEAKLLEKEKAFESEKIAFAEREKTLKDKIVVKDKEYAFLQLQQEAMSKCIIEYETTIQQLISDQQSMSEDNCAKLAQTMKECDATLEELNSMERSFSDLLRKYNKMKMLIEDFQKNEESLKVCAEDWRQRIVKEQQRYQVLKSYAEEMLENANQEIDAQRNKAANEIAQLQAVLKKCKLKCGMLERSLQAKTHEVEELTTICDELINKVGPESGLNKSLSF